MLRPVWNNRFARDLIKEIVIGLPLTAITGETESMFKTVVMGFMTPGSEMSQQWPAACILPVQYGSVNYTDGDQRAVNSFAGTIPVLAYFNFPNPVTGPEQASEAAENFIGLLHRAVYDRNLAGMWLMDYTADDDFDLTRKSGTGISLSIRMGKHDTGQPLKRVDVNYEILPPFYGVLVELDIEYFDSEF